MSNLIKGGFTKLTDELEKIDSNEKAESFVAGLTPAEDMSADKSVAINEQGQPEIIRHVLPPEVERAIKEQASVILGHAKEEEKNIKAQALKEAKIQKQHILDEAKEQGYKDGYSSGLDMLKQMEDELKERMNRNREEYESLVNELEPAFAGLIVKYVEKLTGVVLEDKIPIIGYLMRTAIMDANPSKHYLIHVSLEEYDDAKAEEDELKSILGGKAELEVISDGTLARGDCRIEMDNCVLDAGLGVRMDILKENLQMLVEEV